MPKRSSSRLFVRNLLVSLTLLAAPLVAFAQTVWTGAAGDGAFTNPLNWTAGVPTSAVDATIATGTSVLPTTVILNASGSVDNLTLGAFNNLNLLDSASLNLTLGSTATNGGSIALQGAGASTHLYVGNGTGTTTLTGGGTVTLSNTLHNGNTFIYGDNGVVLDNVNNTISGEGQIGAAHAMGYVNGSSAVVDANVNGQSLTFNLGGSLLTNDNLLEATNGGTLVLLNQVVDNSGATIKASGAGSQVALDAATIHGGSLTGAVTANTNTVLDGTTSDGITLNNVAISDGSFVTVAGTVHNTGSITVQSTGDQTTLYVGNGVGTTTLTGGGTVNLSDSAHNAEAFVYGDNGVTLDNINNTIQGEGLLGGGHAMAYTNEAGALVDANVSGQAIAINLGGQTLTNKNVLEATKGGLLQFISQTVNNAAGSISTDTGHGSQITLNNSTIQAGTLNGPVTVTGSSTLDGQTLGTLTNAGSVGVSDALTLTLMGTINNTGSLTLNSTGDQTTLYVGNGAAVTTTLQGGGTVTLADTAHNSEAIILGDNGATLDNVDNTIQGEGLIGVGHALNVTNEAAGLVNANVSGRAIVFDLGGSTLTNKNLLEATNGGTLQLNSATVNNSEASITASGANSQLGFSSSTVNNLGGTVTASGAGTGITLNSATLQGGAVTGTLNVQGTSGLDGATDGSLTYTGAATVNDGASLIVTGTVANKGSIALEGTGDSTSLYVGNGTGTTTLTGGGTVTLSNTLHNGNTFIYGDNGVVLDNVNNTISGEGQIGAAHAMGYVNGSSAVVDANVNGQSLTFNLGGSLLTNDNLLEATNGGTLVLLNQVVDNSGATIKASGAGSQVALDAATIHGGSLTGAVTANTNTVLDGTTSDGITLNNVAISDGSFVTVAGTVHNTGSITVQSTGDQTTLYVGNGVGTTTLTGGGTVNLSDSAHNAEAFVYGDNGVTLDNINNTIQGEGLLGGGHAMAYTNEAGALVDANVSGQAIAINLGGQTLTNKNVLEATKGGLLQFISQTVNNAAGSISTDTGHGSQITLNNSTIQAGTLNGPVTVTGSSTLDGQTLGTLTNAGSVGVSDALTLTLMGTINNTGSLTLNSTGDQTTLYVGNGAAVTTTLQGGGTVTLADTAHNSEAIILGDNGATLDNVDNTIQGEGLIGVGHALNVTNEAAGLVNANVSGRAIVFDLGGSTLTNKNLLEATNGGTLQLNSATVNNSEASITASGANSQLGFSSSTVNNLGGTVTASGAGTGITLNSATLQGGAVTGTLNVQGTSGLDGATDGSLTYTGAATVNDGASLIVTGTVANKGSIALEGTGDSTSLYVGNGTGTTTLTGGGTVTLSNTLHNGNTFIYGDNGVVLDNVNNTISGEGQIGAAHAMGYVNGSSAVVDANVNGQSLTFNLGGSLLTNDNLLEATNGGTLVLLNQVVDNSGATIKASGAGSQVALDAATIHGGSLTGAVTANTNTVLDGTTSDGITLNNVAISDGSFVTVAGTVHNTGSITVQSTGDQTTLYVGNGVGTTTLTGGGTVNLSDSAHNAEAFVYGDNGVTLDNINNTIQGEGLLGGGHAMAYTNEAGALVDANVSGQAIAINLGGQTLTNKNVLEATKGGLLQFISQTVNNAAGSISTDTGHGSQITLNNSTIQAGTLNGPVTVTGSSTLDGQTLGTLTNAGSVGVSDALTLTLMGTINNTGSLTLNSTGDQTTLYVGNGAAVTTTLQGGGTVTLADTAHNSEAIILGDNGATLDNVDNTIQGEGLIGVGHALNVTNEAAGTILANSPGNTLTISGTSLTNNGTLQANAGSTLLASASLTNFSGNTLTGGTYVVNGSSAPGGTGTMQLNLPANTGGEIVNNAATIVLNGPTANTLLQDLNGNDALSALASNSTANSSLTVKGGYTFTTAGSFANAGTIHAGSGGAFNASSGLTGATGTLQIDAGGAASVAGGSTSSTTGTLAQNGTLALGGNNITVSTDYTNANFGVGNSFNNHANVTGSGLILAAGNTAISVSGSAISNGGTATPSLAFANLHVGQSETLDYSVTNTGTTGPSVRGAIQTNVNGGNITDSRLSGTGVTAGNYGPLGLGQSANYSITFDATTAGALAPGQAVHVATNFDNVQAPTIGFSGGAAYNLASASLGSVNFGKVLVGTNISQFLSITNTAPSGPFSEGLDATLGAFSGQGSGQLSGSGSVTNLAAGSANSNGLQVTLNATTAGTIDANVLVNLTSDGATTSHLGLTSLASQSASITGMVNEVVEVGNLAAASPAAPNPVNLGSVRLGTASPVQLLSISNTATGPAEGLNGSIATASSGLVAHGSFTSLQAGDTSSSDLSVAMDTTSAGLKSGTATITLASDGTFNGGVQTPLPSQTVAVSGAVYQTAQASTLPPTVNLGTVRTGTVINTALSISNVAPDTGGYTETLGANFGVSSAGLKGNSSITGLAQGAPASSAMSVTYTAGAAGGFSGSSTVNFASEAINSSGLGTYALGSQTVDFTALVNALASLKLSEVSGPAFFSTGVDSGTLNFGSVKQGGGSVETLLNLLNNVSGPADDLLGSIDTSNLASTPFSFDGNTSFDLAAGDGMGFGISFNEDAATGGFTETITLDEASHNAFQSDFELPQYVLTVEGTIRSNTATVPDTRNTLMLLALGFAALVLFSRRTRKLSSIRF